MLFIWRGGCFQLFDGLLDLEKQHLGQLGFHCRSEVVFFRKSLSNTVRPINVVTSEDLDALLESRRDIDVNLEERDPLAHDSRTHSVPLGKNFFVRLLTDDYFL